LAANVSDNLVERVLARDFRAVARLITLIENDDPAAISCLRRLYPHSGRCLSVGITGAPGSGKSTLVEALAGYYRLQEKTVGIIAVDPSSPFTGGAILGDRIRMQARSTDPGVFIRSMANRGQLGGLARATNDVLLALDAAGFDIVLIETVGVGQDEVEIARTAAVTLVLVVPGMGDDIQAMKAGVMEIGDIFVINKADRPGVDKVESELEAYLALNHRPDRWRAPVVRTVASSGEGVEECARAIAEYEAFLRQLPPHDDRKLQIARDRLLELTQMQLLRQLLAASGAAGAIDELAAKVAGRELDPFSAAEQLVQLACGSGKTVKE
jgi:LAO/AO transport system kinase